MSKLLVKHISATGTPSASNYLRGDGTWSTPAGGGGGSTLSIVSKTANYTMAATDTYVKCDSSGAAFTITLPTSPTTGQPYWIHKTDTSLGKPVTVSTTGFSTTLDTQDEKVQLLYDGSAWFIVERAYYEGWISATCTITGSTTNPTKGTITTEKCYWKRNGAGIDWHYDLVQASGTAGTGDYIFSTPSGMPNIDSTIQLISINIGDGTVGPAAVIPSGGNALMVGNTKIYNATGFAMVKPGVNSGCVGSNDYPLSSAFANHWSLRALSVPITGWKG